MADSGRLPTPMRETPDGQPRRSAETGGGSEPTPGLALQITQAFGSGQLDLSERRNPPPSGWDGMPETQALRALEDAGVDARTRRLVTTFLSAMERSRDATALWRRGLELFEQARWAYEPAEIVERGFDALRDILQETGVSKMHSVDQDAWWRIAQSLNDAHANPRMCELIDEGTGDVVELLCELRRPGRFPLLRGPKIAPMWLRILLYPGGAHLTSVDAITIAVDVQVREVTENLGVTDTASLSSITAAKPLIQRAWAEDVERGGAVGPGPLRDTVAAVDPALWFYGAFGCSWCLRVGRRVPISPICERCVLPDVLPRNEAGRAYRPLTHSSSECRSAKVDALRRVT